MTLRDALAAALRSITNQSTHLDPCVAYDWTNPREVALSTDMAEAILSDPAFREALVEAVEGGLRTELSMSPMADDIAVRAERDRIAAGVEGLPAYLIEEWTPAAALMDGVPLRRVELSPSTVTLTRTGDKDGFVDRAAVLAVVRGEK